MDTATLEAKAELRAAKVAELAVLVEQLQLLAQAHEDVKEELDEVKEEKERLQKMLQDQNVRDNAELMLKDTQRKTQCDAALAIQCSFRCFASRAALSELRNAFTIVNLKLENYIKSSSFGTARSRKFLTFVVEQFARLKFDTAELSLDDIVVDYRRDNAKVPVNVTPASGVEWIAIVAASYKEDGVERITFGAGMKEKWRELWGVVNKHEHLVLALISMPAVVGKKQFTASCALARYYPQLVGAATLWLIEHKKRVPVCFMARFPADLLREIVVSLRAVSSEDVYCGAQKNKTELSKCISAMLDSYRRGEKLSSPSKL